MNHSIYGLHEGPVDWLGATPGYVVQTIHVWQTDRVEEIPPHVVIVRLNNGYGEDGTIPAPGGYRPFAERCAEIAANSPDVHRWIVGNEPNHPQEWPAGMRIYPDEYADCYSLCRTAIQAEPGHSDDEILVAAMAPWCALVTYFGNERGDWAKYLQDTIAMIGEPDGYALHAYTHAHDPALIASETRMDPPFADRRFEFRAYRDFMNAIPDSAPVYVTECCPVDSGWQNTNNGWVQGIYAEIDGWSREHSTKQIRCLALYRGIDADRWYFADKGQVRDDWNAALAHGYSVVIDEGDDDVSEEWTYIYQNGFEDGRFVDPIPNVPEITIPAGHEVEWDAAHPRPEFDKKRLPQPEVYAGNYSSVGFHVSTEFRWWIRTAPIAVTAGRPTRASAALMVVSHGIGGDNSRPGACGMRVGLALASVTDRDSPDIVWSDWWVVRDTLINERMWRVMQTPEISPQIGQVRLWVQCNADVAAAISAGHWDNELIEQRLEGNSPGVGEIDYNRIRTIMDEALADREPVRWPR